MTLHLTFQLSSISIDKLTRNPQLHLLCISRSEQADLEIISRYGLVLVDINVFLLLVG